MDISASSLSQSEKILIFNAAIASDQKRLSGLNSKERKLVSQVLDQIKKNWNSHPNDRALLTKELIGTDNTAITNILAKLKGNSPIQTVKKTLKERIFGISSRALVRKKQNFERVLTEKKFLEKQILHKQEQLNQLKYQGTVPLYLNELSIAAKGSNDEAVLTLLNSFIDQYTVDFTKNINPNTEVSVESIKKQREDAEKVGLNETMLGFLNNLLGYTDISDEAKEKKVNLIQLIQLKKRLVDLSFEKNKNGNAFFHSKFYSKIPNNLPANERYHLLELTGKVLKNKTLGNLASANQLVDKEIQKIVKIVQKKSNKATRSSVKKNSKENYGVTTPHFKKVQYLNRLKQEQFTLSDIIEQEIVDIGKPKETTQLDGKNIMEISSLEKEIRDLYKKLSKLKV